MAKKKTVPKKKEVVIPPMPKSDIALGAYTPEILAWRKKYYPEEYAGRYAEHVKKFNVKLPDID